LALDIVGEEEFEKEVLQSDVPVLVDFWAPWCGPCRMVSPVVEEFGSENEGKLKVVKIDVDQNAELATKFQVQAVPTLLLFKAGEVVESLLGAVPKAEMENKLGSHL
jgi:thioredoxin 1